MKALYNSSPKNLGKFYCHSDEYFSYTYLPIKLRGQSSITNEPRLKPFDSIIGRSCCDFVGEYGLNRFVDSYVYITAKHQNQREGGFNRPGWHSDGFGTEDISYIWSDTQPTIFNRGEFFLSDDDIISMREMEEQAKEENNYFFEDFSLIRMDQFVIHKVGDYIKSPRTFIKVCISKDKYRLKGNSINHLLNYKWEYVDRKAHRNIPQSEN